MPVLVKCALMVLSVAILQSFDISLLSLGEVKDHLVTEASWQAMFNMVSLFELSLIGKLILEEGSF